MPARPGLATSCGRQNAADSGPPHRLSQQTGIDRSLEADGGAAAIIDHSGRLPVAERQVHRQLGRDLEHLNVVRIGIALIPQKGLKSKETFWVVSPLMDWK